jgi:hypothetical protein
MKTLSGESVGVVLENWSGAYVEPDRLRLTRSCALTESVNQPLMNKYVSTRSAKNRAEWPPE